uniref:Rab-GAP TBC domain-containing protein n=1 Tax=Xiphophorus couchianus TaxID=32473 RepID=A0A3B5M4Y1_9TELE
MLYKLERTPVELARANLATEKYNKLEDEKHELELKLRNAEKELHLKALLRSGVPQQYRQRVWRWLVRTRTRTVWDRTSPHPACRQIQLDLHRTLTTNQNFSSPSSPALQQLRRVLLAFSWQNPAVGYCQGLNRLAAVALLVLQSEEDAFWCLVALVDAIMPQDYYTKNLLASQVSLQPGAVVPGVGLLAAHLEGHGVDVSLVTFNWFLVVFVESLPSDILLPLWDAFLYEETGRYRPGPVPTRSCWCWSETAQLLKLICPATAVTMRSGESDLRTPSGQRGRNSIFSAISGSAAPPAGYPLRCMMGKGLRGGA